MPIWIAGLVLLFSASAFAAARHMAGQSPGPIGQEKGMSVRKMLSMSRDQIEEMLEFIDRTEEPDPVMGAMCYEMAAGPSVIEYICPVCGERTVYDDYSIIWKVEDLFLCRDLFQQIQQATELDLQLDESTFCDYCVDGQAEPELCLIVDLEDAEPCSTVVSQDDLRLLLGFLSGETSYETFNAGTMPIRPQLERVRKLLGLEQEAE